MNLLHHCLTTVIAVLHLQAQPHPIDPPALADSGMPYLTSAPNGNIHLSWIDPLPNKHHALRFSRWTGKQWTPPETIASGPNWFINWADFSSLAILPDGAMLAHWLTRNQTGGKYGYGIRIARRAPKSTQWREIHGLSLDQQEDYAGFLTFVPNSPSAIYLSPPADAGHAAHGGEHAHRKTVRFVSFSPTGALLSDKELDPDACSCCQTAIGATQSGLIAAYRDHLPGEIRDISVVRFTDGAWTQPKTLHPDGWKINGCPTEGPAISSSAQRVAIAWLTRANQTPKIQVALSSNEGVSFNTPQRIDAGNPAGRPTITAFDDGYLIVWLEKTSSTAAEIRARRITHGGRLFPAFTVAQATSGRGTGFPKIAVSGNQVLFAWRAEKVRSALLTKQEIYKSEQSQK